jgi:hypothetical protein
MESASPPPLRLRGTTGAVGAKTGKYDVTDPYSAGFTSRVHNGPRDYDLSFSFGFTLKPTSAVSSREYRAGAVLES